MKHEAISEFDQALLMKGLESSDLKMDLLRITAVSDQGIPSLENDAGFRVLSLNKFPPEAIGQLAVCRQAMSVEPLLVVLGYVELDLSILGKAAGSSNLRPEKADESANNEAIIFKCGRSELRLYPSGKIKLIGDDVSLRARGHMALRGAVLDLN